MTTPPVDINPDQSTEYGGFQFWLGPFGDVIIELSGNHGAFAPRRARHLAAIITAYADASDARGKTGSTT